jgi:Zn-dependent protease with chaperone function/tellurite resistance protein
MNFFERQDRARKNTTKLVILFAAAVIGIVISVNAVVFAVVYASQSQTSKEISDAYDPLTGRVRSASERVTTTTVGEVLSQWPVFAVVTGATLLVILVSSLYRIYMLSEGGPAVAFMVGGRPIYPEKHAKEKVLLNVVEEMSIASGAPMPHVFVLENERGINAFAAGLGSADATIAVTQGALDRLNRDELQGVIAHEFSHILNGDMRLNLKLIGLLHGILAIAMIGYLALRSAGRGSGSRNGKGAAVIAIIGIALIIIGSLGELFGRLIQAAVSRQREYLADASAVQFTRNPSGLAGALKKLGGESMRSRIDSPQAHELAHLFFGSAFSNSFSRLMATHPPLVERIRAIDPSFDGRLERIDPVNEVSAFVNPDGVAQGMGFAEQGVAAARTPYVQGVRPLSESERRVHLEVERISARVGAPSPADLQFAQDLLAAIPTALLDAAHDPFAARAVIYILLLNRQPNVRARQMELIRAEGEQSAIGAVLRLQSSVESLGTEARLPLLNLSLSGLRAMSQDQLAKFMQCVQKLITIDREVTLIEWAMHRILRQSLGFVPPPPQPPRFASLKAVADDVSTLLSALAWVNGDASRAEMAYRAAWARLGVNEFVAAQPVTRFESVEHAIEKLRACAPAIQRRVIEAFAVAVSQDGTVTAEEGELLRAFAMALECPLPPVVRRLERMPA